MPKLRSNNLSPTLLTVIFTKFVNNNIGCKDCIRSEENGLKEEFLNRARQVGIIAPCEQSLSKTHQRATEERLCLAGWDNRQESTTPDIAHTVHWKG